MEAAATGNNSEENKYPEPKKSCKFYSCVSNKSGDSNDMACFGYL